MSKLENVRRILKEDFPGSDQKMVDKLAFILNNFMDQTVSQVNGNLDFENLNRELKTITIKVDTNGTPIGNSLISTDLLTVTGIKIIRATNKDSVGVYPTSHPFISYSGSVPTIRIRNITGLQTNTKYELVLELIA